MELYRSAAILSGLIPLAVAFWANRATSLAHALAWACVAWLSWTSAVVLDDAPTLNYLALCLTGGAGVAVLGARRPHVFAWNFVVLSLVAVMMWPIVETQLLGASSFDRLRVYFAAATLAVGIANYLPTRLAPAAALLMLVCEVDLLWPADLAWLEGDAIRSLRAAALASVPWLGWACWALVRKDRTEFDSTWLDFRDRWGFVWSQRAREQFNLAAQNAGWPVKLTWSGLAARTGGAAPAEDRSNYLVALRAVLQRFLVPDVQGGGH